MKPIFLLLLFNVMFFPWIKAEELNTGASVPEENFEIVFDNGKSEVPYRIPAIAKNREGDLITVADYRYSKADIGVEKDGKIDLRYRIKDADTGEWGEILTLASAGEIDGEFVAFGDPCIVADRESDNVLVTSCSGNVSFQKGTKENHQGWAVFRSEDGGKSWSGFDEISNQVFDQLSDRKGGEPQAFFIASGKIEQSSKIKHGDYYRLYCAASVKIRPREYVNYVFYSDDFGKNWKLLGDVDDGAVKTTGDEAKIAELPDGSVLISSRVKGGRVFNVFHYSEESAGKGQWGEEVFSGKDTNGIEASDSACNGELLCLPVIRNKDGIESYLLLQSVPMDDNGYRAKVGINYKELKTPEDYTTASQIATGWDGTFEVTPYSSAYSTMCLDPYNNLAFFFEENAYNGGYDMVYTPISLETITKGAYRIRN